MSVFTIRPLRVLAFAAITLCGAAANVANAANVEVSVADVAGKGQVKVAVCDRDRFLKECAHTASAPAQAGSMTITVKDVPAGTWAVVVYEDANDNGKLDRSLIGIPTESYGLSRAATGKFGPPKFDDAAIEVKDDPTLVGIRLQ